MRHWLSKGVAIVVVLTSMAAHAATMDPHKKWLTITTPHFKIHTPERNEQTAKKVAVYAEEAYDKVGNDFNWHPHGRTQVVLTDNYDEANGLATVLPYKYLNLRITSPDPDMSLQLYDDWLRTLIMHEYTHIVHLDQYGGLVTPLRYAFGSIVSPNGATPGWVREGVATYEESKQTQGGRGRSPYGNMMIRTALLQNKFPKLDQLSGPGWKWPGGEGQYIYGVRFLQYLVDTYGADKLAEFNKNVSRSPMLFAVNHQAKRVWHKSFYALWKDWQRTLRQEYDPEVQAIQKAGVTPVQDYVSNGPDVQITAYAYNSQGTQLAYAMNSPHEQPNIRVVDLETQKEEVVSRKFTANQLSFMPDGESIVFSATSLYKRYNLYRDLYVLDLKTKKLKRLTAGLRAQDPDVSPDGKTIVFTSNDDGTKQLMLYNIADKTVSKMPIVAPKHTHYAHPQFSPDGQLIAVSVWRDQGRDIFVYDLKGKLIRQVTQDNAVDGEPSWGPDNNTIYFSSDRTGVSNVFAANLKSGNIQQLSNVMTGVFSPQVVPNSQRLLVKYYNGAGYDLRTLDPETVDWKALAKIKRQHKKDTPAAKTTVEDISARASHTATPAQEEAAEAASFTDKPYSPFGKPLLLPHYVSPFFTTLDNGLMFGGVAGSSDPLQRHLWMAGANYRTDSEHLGYSFSYSYQRYRPILNLSYIDYSANLGTLNFVSAGVTTPKLIYENRRRGSATISYPWTRQVMSLSYAFEHRSSISRPVLTAAEDSFLNFGRFAGLTLGYAYSSASTTKAAISAESGRKLRAILTINNKVLGTLSDNEQQIFAGDVRQYISMPWLHHVLAFRTAGGIAFGEQLVQGTFALGGSLGEGALSAGGDSPYYFALRGLPVSSFVKSRALLFSSEYRMPLIYAQRGWGTMPFYLSDLHLAFFADYGNAWNKSDDLGGYWGFGNFMLGTGAEIRADMVLGHGLPVVGRLGYGIIVMNRNRILTFNDAILQTPAKNGTVILQFGAAF